MNREVWDVWLGGALESGLWLADRTVPGYVRCLIEVANHTGASNLGLITAADPVTESRYSHHRFVTGYTGVGKGRNGCRPWSAPVFIFR